MKGRPKSIFLLFMALGLIIVGVFAVATLVHDDSNDIKVSTKDNETKSTCPPEPASDDEIQDECVIPPGDEITIPDTDNLQPDDPNVEPAPPPEPPPAPEQKPLAPTPTEISRGDTNKKQVIFTFDGGAGSQSLSKILSALQKHQIKGTFFVTGKWAESNRIGLQTIVNNGHEIFNHTYSHPNLTLVSAAVVKTELSEAESTIKNITGKTTKPFFRPPYGARNQDVLDAAWKQGYQSVYWTVDALDWQEGITADQVKSRVLNNVSSGAIFLMHIGDDITGQVLDELFTTIRARGYSITSLTQGL